MSASVARDRLVSGWLSGTAATSPSVMIVSASSPEGGAHRARAAAQIDDDSSWPAEDLFEG